MGEAKVARGRQGSGPTRAKPVPAIRAAGDRQIRGTAHASGLFRPSERRARIAHLDLGLLDVRDRACLRLLRRIEVATPDQLAMLIYPSRRTSFRHLRRLWQLGLLERAPLLPNRGGVPIAYRLTRRGMNRLGYADRRSGGLACCDARFCVASTALLQYLEVQASSDRCASARGTRARAWCRFTHSLPADPASQ